MPLDSQALLRGLSNGVLLLAAVLAYREYHFGTLSQWMDVAEESQKHISTPLQADHPERPTITLGWSLQHPRGILNNHVFLVDFMVSRSGWHGNRGVFICSPESHQRSSAQSSVAGFRILGI